MTLNPFLCIDLSISDSLRSVRKSVLIYEAIIDVSSMLKFNGHAETVQKILDVVKKKETLLLRMNFYQNSEKQIVCMEW